MEKFTRKQFLDVFISDLSMHYVQLPVKQSAQAVKIYAT